MNGIGEKAWDGLIALLAASLDQSLELPACFCLGALVARRGRGEPVGVPDAVFLVGLLVTSGLLARRILRSPERPLAGIGLWYKTPAGTTGPTASWAHVPWSLLYFGVGDLFWTVHDAETNQTHLGGGLGFLLVAGGFLALRVACRIARAL